MKIALLQTGKTTDQHIAKVIDLYTSRINKYLVFEIITLPDIKNSRSMSLQEKKMKEGKRIIQSIYSEDYVILLDENGNEFKTVDFSAWLEKLFMIRKKRIVFVIGGAWGLSDEVFNRANYRLALSRMTYSHQMVRLLFLEQLYRAFTVIRGEPYHHD